MSDIIGIQTDGSESTVELKLKAVRRELAEQRAVSRALSLFPGKALDVDHVDSIKLGPLSEQYGFNIAHSYRVLVILDLTKKEEEMIQLDGSQRDMSQVDMSQVNMSTVSRMYRDYEFTNHAKNRFKQRDISLQMIKTAINEGKIYDEDSFPSQRLGMKLEKPNLLAFELTLPKSLFLLVDPFKPEENIVTVFLEDGVDTVEPSKW